MAAERKPLAPPGEDWSSMVELVKETLAGGDMDSMTLTGMLKENGVPYDTSTKLINHLMATFQVVLMQQGDSMSLHLNSAEEQVQAQKMARLSNEEKLVFQAVEETQREGIWTKDLKYKTGLHKSVIDKALAKLVSVQLIRTFKPASSKSRKMYMLYSLEPVVDTSDVWYTNQELIGFVDNVSSVVLQFIQSRSSVTAEDVAAHLASHEAIKPPLALVNVQELIELLIRTGEVARLDESTFVCAPQSVPTYNGFTHTPCGHCPVFGDCHEDGIISPAKCIYLDDW
ncbi:DNA-directed RNA polymerase III subunit RPC6 [Thecamonas trahens ATCC 50062]|uniref:DNA-directed RNA polymerase III subunit RPC6 n=1 Tax=Thecamonas trahens ATCC 50062 TaxID=461836 RepID=A0A0L0DEB7_THETB|nr:DNA-directed RNA polymerase III subunit RPC6 [Thecamonas trahens ATCC 50062]KNC50634.1 DNA-directed RNA polymerase III subunit RPC6 [Thecamonas trahens ATCC 50062]|eukprot:XP_013762520.1 DNA-directed RNA polymerase III subunit RPC6 [Thecamonas trahens ATCC 50062]